VARTTVLGSGAQLRARPRPSRLSEIIGSASCVRHACRVEPYPRPRLEEDPS
jgi:hypothetical protein